MKRIANKYLPPRLPVLTTAVAWLLLDRLRPPGWAYGVAWTFIAVLWVGTICECYLYEPSRPRDV